MKRFSLITPFGFVMVLFAQILVPQPIQAQIRFGSGIGATLLPKVVVMKEVLPAVALTKLPTIESLGAAAPFQTVTITNLFAQIAFGGGFTTIFSFVNTGAATATANLILNDDFGQPLRAAFTSPGNFSITDYTYALSVPPGGSQEVLASPVDPIRDPTKTGWARVESTAGSLGGVATYQFAPGGAPSIIVGVLSAQMTSAATIPVDDNHPSQVDTGYAIANPGSSPINIKIIFVNPDGTIRLSVTPPSLNPLPPGWHIARYLWQDANDAAFQFRGSVAMIEQTGKPFSVVSLVFNHGLLTAIPAVPGSAPNIK